jgi:hypothetical protein
LVLYVDAKNVEFTSIRWSSGVPELDAIAKCVALIIATYDLNIIFQVVPREINEVADVLSKISSFGVDVFRELIAKYKSCSGRFASASLSSLSLPDSRFWLKPRPSFW